MMRQFELVERVQSYNPDADDELLHRAYVYAMRAHGAQTRASGDPYFTHPLEVAAILTELKVDDATIVAALLHDTIEDTDATREEIERLFGRDIAQLVEGLTKLKRLDLVVKQAAQAENLRKLLLAVVSDVRVLLVKLADRLHNMRTLHYVPPDKRQRIAEETLDIYAPLAGRMGMQDMRDELEDLAFAVMHPEQYRAIIARLGVLSARLAGEPGFEGGFIAAIEREVGRTLAKQGIVATVRGRQKRPYSIYRKTLQKGVAFEQLSDIYGFRVIVEAIADCYAALGVIHTTWPMVPGRYKDYISTPKSNDYRSLHTTVIGPGRQRVELQIRTATMDRVAEYGIAAHTLYKDGVFVAHEKDGRVTLNADSSSYDWLRRTVERLSEGSSPEEFLEHTKLELFQDQVFCFSPKGKLIALPRGATPIDFAYAVHTSVGNTCVGCRINGKTSPLSSQLANGDEVEVVTSRNARPPRTWEAIAITGKARYEIRKATREDSRAQFAEVGRTLLKRAFERAERTYSDSSVEAVLRRLARPSLGEALAAVGRGEMKAEDVLRAVHPDWRDERKHAPALKLASPPTAEKGWFDAKGGRGMKFRVPDAEPAADPLPIRGITRAELPVRFAQEGAVPGDRIVGIVTPGEGITIYPIHAEALRAFDEAPERWLDVRWDLDEGQEIRFPARIELQTVNEPGTLAQITSVIAEHDGNIDNVKMSRLSPETTDMLIDLEVWDLKHLNAIISQLKARSVVSSVKRVSN